MTVSLALAAIIGLTVRAIVRGHRTLNDILATSHACETSWCACTLGDDDPRCENIGPLIFGDADDRCTLPVGHDGMHRCRSRAWSGQFGTWAA